MNSNLTTRLAVLGLYAASSLLCASASAQNKPAPDVNLSEGGLEEVVVRARKREEKLKDVPISITSIGDEELRKAGITSVESLAATVPGFQYSQARDRNSSLPGIRGVKSTEISPNRQKVSTFNDGMPVLGQQGVSQFVDVGRVEVYRGPQSSQFGRAVFAGAVNYISVPANMNKITGKSSFTLGSDSTRTASGLITGPLIEGKLALLLAGNVDTSGGPGSQLSSDGYELGSTASKYFSSKVAYQPVDWLLATLRYQYLNTNDGVSTNYHLDYTDPQFQLLPTSIAPNVNAKTSRKTVIGEVNFHAPDTANNRNFCYLGGTVLTPGAKAASSTYLPNCTNDPRATVQRDRITADFAFDLPNDYQLSVNGFKSHDRQIRVDDPDRSALLPYYNTTTKAAVNATSLSFDDSGSKEKFAEAILISPAKNRLRGTLGVSWYYYDFLTQISNNLTTGAIAQVFADETTNKGIFGALQFDVSEKLTTSVELRYQEELVSNFSALINKGFAQNTKTSLPRFAVVYKINNDLNFYAQVAKGNNPAGVNVDTLTTNKQLIATKNGTLADLNGFLSYDEETMWSYEAGLKGTLFDNKVSFDFDIYQLDWDNYVTVTNYQIATSLLYSTPGADFISSTASDYTSRVFYNAGKVKGRGMELSAQYKPNNILAFSFAYAWTDTKYGKACSPDIVGYGLPIYNTKPSSCVNIAGNSIPGIASHAANLGTTVTSKISDSIEWTNRLDTAYISKILVDDANFAWISPKTTLNFRSGFSKGGTSVDFYVKNLTNNLTPNSATSAPNPYVYLNDFTLSGNASQRYAGQRVAPRQWGATVNFRF